VGRTLPRARRTPFAIYILDHIQARPGYAVVNAIRLRRHPRHGHSGDDCQRLPGDNGRAAAAGAPPTKVLGLKAGQRRRQPLSVHGLELTKNIVAGEWIDPPPAGTWRYWNPWRRARTIAEVPRGGTQRGTPRAAEAAKQALPEWLRENTLAMRRRGALRPPDMIDEHSEELLRLESQNVGQAAPRRRDEMPSLPNNIASFAGAAAARRARPQAGTLRGLTSMCGGSRLASWQGITPLELSA